MSIDNLRSALPEWAKDLSLNLSTLSRSSSLTEQQQWGTFVAAAAATRNESVLVQVMEDARTHLSEEAINAALGAASIMAMNNVAYRTRHFLGSAYENERMGLRMNIISTSGGVDKVDFELWSLAVSTINGCEKCVTAHEATVRGEGLSTEQVWEAVRIAATLPGGALGVGVVEPLACPYHPYHAGGRRLPSGGPAAAVLSAYLRRICAVSAPCIDASVPLSCGGRRRWRPGCR